LLFPFPTPPIVSEYDIKLKKKTKEEENFPKAEIKRGGKEGRNKYQKLPGLNDSLSNRIYANLENATGMRMTKLFTCAMSIMAHVYLKAKQEKKKPLHDWWHCLGR
jgi:hypothetical protein